MARMPRLALPGLPHHVIHRGHNRQPVFLQDGDRRAWKEALADALQRTGVKLHAYVLMDNHVHLLLTPPEASALSKAMQFLGRRYVGGFNAVHGRSGTLWEGRFRAAPVETERYLLACMRYIELNPVRAGMVVRAEDHPWSSAAHHLGLRIDPLVSDHALYWDLGNTPFDRQSHYRALLEAPALEAERTQITESALKGWALGSAEFRSAWEDRSPRALAPRPRGRPRREASPEPDPGDNQSVPN